MNKKARKKLPILILAVIIFLGSFIIPMPVYASRVQPPGSGTIYNPYRISTPEHFLWMQLPAGRRGHFVLLNDITITTGRVNHFAGVFDGRGHTIHVDRTQGGGGIFGFNDSRAVISNVHVAGYIVGERANASSVGGLIDTNYGVIFNVSSTVTVTLPTVVEGGRIADGGLRVGGLVGNNYGVIVNSYAGGAVTGSRYVGGLVGINRGHIINSIATGNVWGDQEVGALVGLNTNGRDSRSPDEARIHQSRATGNVTWAGGRADRRTGELIDIGGMVGRNADGAIIGDEPIESGFIGAPSPSLFAPIEIVEDIIITREIRAEMEEAIQQEITEILDQRLSWTEALTQQPLPNPTPVPPPVQSNSQSAVTDDWSDWDNYLVIEVRNPNTGFQCLCAFEAYCPPSTSVNQMIGSAGQGIINNSISLPWWIPSFIATPIKDALRNGAVDQAEAIWNQNFRSNRFVRNFFNSFR